MTTKIKTHDMNYIAMQVMHYNESMLLHIVTLLIVLRDVVEALPNYYRLYLLLTKIITLPFYLSF